MLLQVPPKCFNARCMSRLKAGAGTVRLRDKSSNFYMLGLRLGVLLRDATLAPQLRRAFATRYGPIMDRALNSLDQDNSMFLRGLTDMERRIFANGFESARMYTEWKRGRAGMLNMARVAKIGAKRKR